MPLDLFSIDEFTRPLGQAKVFSNDEEVTRGSAERFDREAQFGEMGQVREPLFQKGAIAVTRQ
jgi:hypothetical protein